MTHSLATLKVGDEVEVKKHGSSGDSRTIFVVERVTDRGDKREIKGRELISREAGWRQSVYLIPLPKKIKFSS